MNFKDFKKYCLSFTSAEELSSYTDDTDITAFEVMDEVFAITNSHSFDYIHIKCDPVKAAMLRNLYEDVQPSDYESKKRWNEVNLKGILDDAILYEWIRDSYELAFEDLSRKKQRKIESLRKKEEKEKK
jgi:predicted DNA-binding protein (MmcQ/YjbR family)